MTDKELLELAAKAAGIDHPGGEHSIYNDGRLWDCKSLRWWNPLTDDSDALRLAVQLDIDIIIRRSDSIVLAQAPMQRATMQPIGDCALAATRRAITRCAAEIGRMMESNDD